MISSAKKLLLAGGGKIKPQTVFATALYTGDASPSHKITNNLDVLGKGGLVWIKHRQKTYSHRFFDTLRVAAGGDPPYLSSDTSSAEISSSLDTIRFNGDGFATGPAEGVNENGQNFASWTFRRSRKFFDIVTWTGDGQSDRKIPHGLASVPGFIVVKARDGNTGSNWPIFHRSLGAQGVMALNGQGGVDTATPYWTAAPTAVDFSISNNAGVNGVGRSYVAYVFAQNPDLIDCGALYGNGTPQHITCGQGWRPQFLLWKRTDALGDWLLVDAARGFTPATVERLLKPNMNSIEDGGDLFEPDATGFNALQAYNPGVNFIYLAIRSPT